MQQHSCASQENRIFETYQHCGQRSCYHSYWTVWAASIRASCTRVEPRDCKRRSPHQGTFAFWSAFLTTKTSSFKLTEVITLTEEEKQELEEKRRKIAEVIDASRFNYFVSYCVCKLLIPFRFISNAAKEEGAAGEEETAGGGSRFDRQTRRAQPQAGRGTDVHLFLCLSWENDNSLQPLCAYICT